MVNLHFIELYSYNYHESLNNCRKSMLQYGLVGWEQDILLIFLISLFTDSSNSDHYLCDVDMSLAQEQMNDIQAEAQTRDPLKS